MGSGWQTADAKNQFTKLVEAAEQNGPQVILRHKEPVAVILSAAEYRRLHRQAGSNFGRLLAETPFEAGDVPAMGASLSKGEEPAPGQGGDERPTRVQASPLKRTVPRRGHAVVRRMPRVVGAGD